MDSPWTEPRTMQWEATYMSEMCAVIHAGLHLNCLLWLSGLSQKLNALLTKVKLLFITVHWQLFKQLTGWIHTDWHSIVDSAIFAISVTNMAQTTMMRSDNIFWNQQTERGNVMSLPLMFMGFQFQYLFYIHFNQLVTWWNTNYCSNYCIMLIIQFMEIKRAYL
jgi:hypothetical protein